MTKGLKFLKRVNIFLKREVPMRRTTLDIGGVKSKILALKGETVEMNINRGRKRIESVSGVIKDVYPSVFTVVVKESKQGLQTFSYYDVLCGNVVFVEG